ncbi:MAG: hypothetical protein ACJ72N_07095 [Labedaea sp.]
MGITSDKAADLLGIAGGHLRSIENDIKPSSWELAYRAARLYSCDVDNLLAGERVPDEPTTTEQDPEENTGPGRKSDGVNKSKTKRGPKRASGAAA